jgi:adenylylsulfate kinase
MRRVERPAPRPPQPGATVWLTGLPGSGKTAIARALAHQLRTEGRQVEVLHREEMRRHLPAGPGPGSTGQEGEAVVALVGWMAQLLARHGIVTLVPVTAPHAEKRRHVATRHAHLNTCFLEVHVDTPLHARATPDATDEPYEAPADPDLRVSTHARSVKQCAAAVIELLRAKGVLTGREE